MSTSPMQDIGIKTLPPDVLEVDLRRVRLIRGVALAIMAVLALGGVVGLFGVRSTSVSASRNGYHLTIGYPETARPGLDAEWGVQLARQGGFSGPVTLAVSRDYLDVFTMQRIIPEPASQTSAPPYLYLTFERPPGDSLDASFETNTGATLGETGVHDGEVLVIVDGIEVVRAPLRTVVAP